MQQAELIDRINILARKSRTEGLTPEEKEEQQVLRGLYLKNFRANFDQIMRNVIIEEPDGTQTMLTKKERKGN